MAPEVQKRFLQTLPKDTAKVVFGPNWELDYNDLDTTPFKVDWERWKAMLKNHWRYLRMREPVGSMHHRRIGR